MRIKEKYVKTELGEEALLVPVGEEAEQFRGVVRLNETAAYIVDLLRQDRTEKELTDALLEAYDVERAVAEKDVKAMLDTLRNVHALAD